ncbi:hypothetical protein [Teredinibacter sp. KSP-S5-2]|uniref:hypothetical protein n=1 Tax=Teredinibacter sp. KSP-S5-2 TaxID=3034506 RepID=UPI002934635D|nr:hypothetical protein [Teredinibacter sp. KSP-S5-2]WNO09445.1 hypothetical protein P5V12_21115 [Teredinibacter sp. KSP-S5-2]
MFLSLSSKLNSPHNKYLYACFVFLFLFSLPSYSQQPLIIYANSGVMEIYDDFIAGRNKVDINDYTLNSLHSSRSVTETLLFEQALALGGFDKKIKLASERIDYDNKLYLLLSGKALAYTEAFYLDDFLPHQNDLLISDPVIRKNEYFVGLYTSPDNKKALSATADSLGELTATSNNTWVQDWKALNSIGLKKVYHVASWIYMIKMVKNQQADFILSHFQPGPEMRLMWEGHNLVPIPNLKLALPGSRHFVISKKHPNGPELFEALNKGIKILRESGRVSKAYEQAGIFNARVKDWVPLGLEKE